MAMYEDLGFCPNNSFGFEYPEHETGALWARTKELIGDRFGYMVYGKDEMAWGRDVCSIVDVLKYSTSTIGLEIACAIVAAIPTCRYAEYGKKILIRDIITPNQAPAKIGTERDGELIPFADQDPKVRIFQDERYFVEMTEVNDEVCLYIFKKN